MDHPSCPACQKGHLLPMSDLNSAFSFWVSSAPTCAYVVSSSATAVTYYKGSAVQQEKDKGGKRWTEFSFERRLRVNHCVPGRSAVEPVGRLVA
jgi:hypothetical protein